MRARPHPCASPARRRCARCWWQKSWRAAQFTVLGFEVVRYLRVEIKATPSLSSGWRGKYRHTMPLSRVHLRRGHSHTHDRIPNLGTPASMMHWRSPVPSLPLPSPLSHCVLLPSFPFPCEIAAIHRHLLSAGSQLRLVREQSQGIRKLLEC